MCETRNVTSNISAISSESYYSLAAVINYQYAKSQNYSFLYVQISYYQLIDEVRQWYKEKGIPENIQQFLSSNNSDSFPSKFDGWATEGKISPSLFNVKLGQFRASPWLKIPVIMYLISNYTLKWDHIFFLDSDAIINPLSDNMNLASAFKLWQPKIRNMKMWGNDVDVSSIIFFSDHPAGNRINSGSFIVNTKNQNTFKLLKEWWDWNIPEKNFVHPFEQAAIWQMIDSDMAVRKQLSYLYFEHQFPLVNGVGNTNSTDYLQHRFVCHFAWPWKKSRSHLLFDVITRYLGLNFSGINTILEDIRLNHSIYLESFMVSKYI